MRDRHVSKSADGMRVKISKISADEATTSGGSKMKTINKDIDAASAEHDARHHAKLSDVWDILQSELI